MALWTRLPRAEGAVEMLDGPAALAELRECLSDVARLNAFFGGRFLTLVHVKRLAARLPSGRALTVLDVGTGGGDVPRAIVRWARRVRRPIHLFALDRDPVVARVAQSLASAYPEIVVLQGDAVDLPVRSGSVDVVISSLTLHHLDEAAAVRHLAEMDRAARLGIVVNDLARSRTAYALVWLVTRLFTKNRMSRHDGPVSVQRAYVRGELRVLCEKAGLFDARILTYPALLRQCVVRGK
jgi:ubiquinone/menaquinone biosynthesis C-methylase UbiE